MRKLVLGTILLFALSLSADVRRTKEAVEPPAEIAAADAAAASAGTADFPRVAKDQTRRWTPIANPAECITYPDGTSNCASYDPQACNCKRECDVYQCKLSMLVTKKCSIPVYGSFCAECLDPCANIP